MSYFGPVTIKAQDADKRNYEVSLAHIAAWRPVEDAPQHFSHIILAGGNSMQAMVSADTISSLVTDYLKATVK